MQSEDEKKWLAQQQRHSHSDFGNKNFIPKAAAGSVLLEDCSFTNVSHLTNLTEIISLNSSHQTVRWN
nr:BFH_HP1_G0048860.mRNA.1.CDS.1 [Saccharomyces cerevisiae]